MTTMRTATTAQEDAQARTEAARRKPERCQIRQGDILLIPRRKPKRYERAKDEEGSIRRKLHIVGGTGNAHEMPCRVYDSDGRMFVFLERPTMLMHPEHRYVDVAAGWLEVRRQRERSNAAVMARCD